VLCRNSLSRFSTAFSIYEGLLPQSSLLGKEERSCSRFVKALFLFDASPFVERQLNEYAIVGSLDFEISAAYGFS
jgi:hypothetical protein